MDGLFGNDFDLSQALKPFVPYEGCENCRFVKDKGPEKFCDNTRSHLYGVRVFPSNIRKCVQYVRQSERDEKKYYINCPHCNYPMYEEDLKTIAIDGICTHCKIRMDDLFLENLFLTKKEDK